MSNTPSNIIDLSNVGGVTPSATTSLTATSVEDYNPAKDQEKIRGRIAQLLLGVLFVIVITIGGFAVFLSGSCNDAESCEVAKLRVQIVTENMNLIFTSVVGLFGTVIGFYFGSKAEIK